LAAFVLLELGLACLLLPRLATRRGFLRAGPRRLAGRAVRALGHVARIVRFVLAHGHFPSGRGRSSGDFPRSSLRRSGCTTSSQSTLGSGALGVMSPSRSAGPLAG